jgi:tetratricopeptide (TPR) repeat protein
MKFISFLVLFSILFSCSTEKNTLINTSYHGMTAHYNGYFNANELINQALVGYRSSKKEDFYNLLPLESLPGKNEIEALLPALDTAISKCTKVLTNHSMPSVKEGSVKKEEYNKWIDENWLTIGISNFYKQEYDLALKNFDFINKFFSNDPSNYLAAIWMARTHIQIREYSKARQIIKKLDKDLEELNDIKKAQKEDKKSKKKKKKVKSKKKEEKPKAEFTKRSKYLLEIIRTELLIIEEDYEKAIESLKKAISLSKRKERARLYYILAQLNEEKSDNNTASSNYSKVLKYNSPFEMNFSARLKRAMLGSNSKLKSELQKMLREEKNSEFKDQIYFALGEIAFREGLNEIGKSYYTKSIFYSVSNNRQKAMCYEKLGDLAYSEKQYVPAQKYYDSCVSVLPDNYPNGDKIINKAIKLKDLVTAIEIAQYEDSVLRIANLSETERTSFVNKLMKKIKEDEAKKKAMDEARLQQLQKQQMAALEAKSTSKFFWNHTKTKEQGLENYRKIWGQRENEDDWRRSEKIKTAPTIIEENDSIPQDIVLQEPIVEDTLSAELLLSKLPLSDSSKASSYERMFAALYDAGLIYKDQLSETKLALIQFEKIIEKNIASKFLLLALFQAYKIYEEIDPTKSYPLKTRIIAEYPYSDYAKYLNDPDFFVKQKEFEKLNEEEFVKMLDRYNRGLYSFVISASNDVIDNHPENLYRSKYMLLNALAYGQTSSNKRNMLPTLKRIIVEYPNSDEEKRAKELIDKIENGVTPFEESVFNKETIYTYPDKADYFVIIFLQKNQNSMLAKSKVADFNKDQFQKDQLSVSSKIFGTDQSVISVKSFSEIKAKEYVDAFRKSKKDLMNLQKEKIFFISNENMKILFETQKLEEYELFFAEFY